MSAGEIQIHGGKRPERAAGGLFWALSAVMWAPLVWRLARMWGSELEQAFGFGVPALVAWLLWRRRGEWMLAGGPARGAGAAAVAGGGLLAAGLLMLEANPLWPRAAWAGTAGALVLTLGVIASGHGWRGARAAAPVLLLMLTALKWPEFVHGPVMGGLMHVNAVIAAELTSLAGVPALVHGSVIEVARGMVGVDEACSGLRSLQTVIMMALFLGEQDRLRIRGRLALLGGAVAAALAANIARTTTLTWIFARQGSEVEERWHDPAGLVALGATLAMVWLWSERVRRGGATTPVRSRETAPVWRPMAVAAAGVVLIEAGTQAWYFSHENGPERRTEWFLEAPAGSDWGRIEVPPRTAEILRHESGEAYAREIAAPSRQLLAFTFRWSADLARLGMPEAHDPRVCLPSVGAVEEAELPEARVEVDGVAVPFRFVRFRQGTRLQHVWFCLWSTRAGRADPERWQGSDITRVRWSRVAAGLRNDEREQLVFFVQGERDDEGAERTLRDAVLTLMRRR